ncbi:MAG: carboxymuconolactone decarboxylase family protein [Pseudomonas sp.]|nr:carboxymuconolactone decarboxylase family protein [Pseudomonas sp.]
MSEFTLHDQASAPEGSKPLLASSAKAFGMIPGLHAVMAEAPAVLEGYQQLHRLVMESSFDNEEKTVLWQSINVEHACHYCVPAHTGIAKSMKVSDEVIDALRNERPLPNRRLEALRTFVLQVVRKRGEVSEQELKAFYEAGYGRQQVLEVVLGVSQKVMSNYINHIAQTPIDEPFQKFAWTKAE